MDTKLVLVLFLGVAGSYALPSKTEVSEFKENRPTLTQEQKVTIFAQLVRKLAAEFREKSDLSFDAELEAKLRAALTERRETEGEITFDPKLVEAASEALQNIELDGSVRDEVLNRLVGVFKERITSLKGTVTRQQKISFIVKHLEQIVKVVEARADPEKVQAFKAKLASRLAARKNEGLDVQIEREADFIVKVAAKLVSAIRARATPEQLETFRQALLEKVVAAVQDNTMRIQPSEFTIDLSGELVAAFRSASDKDRAELKSKLFKGLVAILQTKYNEKPEDMKAVLKSKDVGKEEVLFVVGLVGQLIKKFEVQLDQDQKTVLRDAVVTKLKERLTARIEAGEIALPAEVTLGREQKIRFVTALLNRVADRFEPEEVEAFKAKVVEALAESLQEKAVAINEASKGKLFLQVVEAFRNSGRQLSEERREQLAERLANALQTQFAERNGELKGQLREKTSIAFVVQRLRQLMAALEEHMDEVRSEGFRNSLIQRLKGRLAEQEFEIEVEFDLPSIEETQKLIAENPNLQELLAALSEADISRENAVEAIKTPTLTQEQKVTIFTQLIRKLAAEFRERSDLSFDAELEAKLRAALAERQETEGEITFDPKLVEAASEALQNIELDGSVRDEVLNRLVGVFKERITSLKGTVTRQQKISFIVKHLEQIVKVVEARADPEQVQAFKAKLASRLAARKNEGFDVQIEREADFIVTVAVKLVSAIRARATPEQLETFRQALLEKVVAAVQDNIMRIQPSEFTIDLSGELVAAFRSASDKGRAELKSKLFKGLVAILQTQYNGKLEDMKAALKSKDVGKEEVLFVVGLVGQLMKKFEVQLDQDQKTVLRDAVVTKLKERLTARIEAGEIALPAEVTLSREQKIRFVTALLNRVADRFEPEEVEAFKAKVVEALTESLQEKAVTIKEASKGKLFLQVVEAFRNSGRQLSEERREQLAERLVNALQTQFAERNGELKGKLRENASVAFVVQRLRQLMATLEEHMDEARFEEFRNNLIQRLKGRLAEQEFEIEFELPSIEETQKLIAENPKLQELLATLSEADISREDAAEAIKNRKQNVDERGLNDERTVWKRTCYCDLQWSPNNDPNDAYSMKNMRHFEPMEKSIMFDVSCRDMLKECRKYCLHETRSYLKSTVPPIDKQAGESACRHFNAYVPKKDSRHLFMGYTADRCQEKVHEYMGEVCCWKCSKGEKIRWNKNCKNPSNEPSDCN